MDLYNASFFLVSHDIWYCIGTGCRRGAHVVPRCASGTQGMHGVWVIIVYPTFTSGACTICDGVNTDKSTTAIFVFPAKAESASYVCPLKSTLRRLRTAIVCFSSISLLLENVSLANTQYYSLSGSCIGERSPRNSPSWLSFAGREQDLFWS